MDPKPFAPSDPLPIRVLPLEKRKHLARLADVLQNPDASPAPCDPANIKMIQNCAASIQLARKNGSSVILMYGAHLLRNGAGLVLGKMIENGWVTHLATNGAGSIHDWEFSFLGQTSESVRDNVATGTFGTWDETGRTINLAILAGGLRGEGYGTSLGRCIMEDGFEIPDASTLEQQLRTEPLHPLAPARAELLAAMLRHKLTSGKIQISHPHKQSSIIGQAFAHKVPMTVHPGIGYDIITNHPLFNGAAIGRAAAIDFRLICGSVEGLDNGVVLSVGSAIMAPQVFEKSMSCVNNMRLQQQRKTVHGHQIFVVDLQEGGNWDWTQGEPPKTNPAYYLRFCKSYARMGGAMHYLCCDNVTFVHHLYKELVQLNKP